MSKIKWGVLGTANIAKWCTIPGMQQAKDCELYAIAGRSLEKATKFKEEYGFEVAYGSYDELIADKEVEAVYIPLPNDLHLKWVKAALNAGKHVLCEKPLALDLKEAEEMYAAAKANNVILMEAYAYLHSPYVLSLIEDVRSGIIGNVDYIESAFITQGYEEDFRLHKEQGGGAMYDLGCYCTTMILSLIDSDPENVWAQAEFSDLGVDLMTAVMLKFKNGARASFNIGMILDMTSNSRFDRLYVHGSKGSIRSEVEYNQEGTLSYRIFKGDEVITRTVEAPSNYSLEVQDMCNAINGITKPHITPEFSLKNMKLIEDVLTKIGY